MALTVIYKLSNIEIFLEILSGLKKGTTNFTICVRLVSKIYYWTDSLVFSENLILWSKFQSQGFKFLMIDFLPLTDTGEDSKLVHRRKRPKLDTLFSSLFPDGSERRVWLSAESKILASTFGRFRLYRLIKKNKIFSRRKIFVNKC